MKSIISITYLLALAIGMAFSKITGIKGGAFQCADESVAASCKGRIEFFANRSNAKYSAEITPDKKKIVFVGTDQVYNDCSEFKNEILGIIDCEQCTPIGADNSPSDYCVNPT